MIHPRLAQPCRLPRRKLGGMHVVQCNDKIHIVWSSGVAAKVASSYARMATVVTDLMGRLDAALRNDGVVCVLQVFGVQEWFRLACLRPVGGGMPPHLCVFARRM